MFFFFIIYIFCIPSSHPATQTWLQFMDRARQNMLYVLDMPGLSVSLVEFFSLLKITTVFPKMQKRK